MANSIIALLVIVVVVVAIGAYVALYSAPTANVGGTGSVSYTVSDARQTLSSVSAVNMQVQSIQMHSTTTGQWYSVPVSGSGNYNLTALTSTYAFVGGANVPAGNYDEIALTATSVTATVNGTAKAVVLPSKVFKVFGNFSVSSTANTGSTNWINFDFKVNQSLHETGNGMIIMLPVIQTVAWSNAKLRIGAGDNVSVEDAGQVTESVEAGMDANGTMKEGLNIPASANVSIGANGTIEIG